MGMRFVMNGRNGPWACNVVHRDPNELVISFDNVDNKRGYKVYEFTLCIDLTLNDDDCIEKNENVNLTSSNPVLSSQLNAQRFIIQQDRDGDFWKIRMDCLDDFAFWVEICSA